MNYSQSPSLVEEWPKAGEAWSGAPPRDLDARSDERIGERPMKPSISSPRASDRVAGEGPSIGRQRPSIGRQRPPIGRRIFRTVTRFSVAVLIGIGATLGWQSYGDAAREIAVARAPSLAWLLYVSTPKSPAVATTSPGPAQQLEPLASNLDAVRRSVEQLAARQEQMAQNMAALQAVEEDIRQKMSSPPSPSQPAASIPQQRNPQPRPQSSAMQPSSVPRPPTPAGPLSLTR
jgi:hypothetical protein